jgi:hypothetical protein
MKTKTKTRAIAEALIDGHKLTVKTSITLCGTYKVGTRLGELEQRHGLSITREWVNSRSRYGGVDSYLQYSVNKTNKKKLQKLIEDNKI